MPIINRYTLFHKYSKKDVYNLFSYDNYSFLKASFKYNTNTILLDNQIFLAGQFKFMKICHVGSVKQIQLDHLHNALLQ
jgi:hypothetical protein